MREEHVKYIFLAFFLISIGLALLVVWPFINVILGSFVIAYIFHPVYDWLKKYLKNENLTAGVVSLLFIIVFTLPFALVIGALSAEVDNIYKLSQGNLVDNLFYKDCTGKTDLGCRMNNIFMGYYSDPSVKEKIDSSISETTAYFETIIKSAILSVPNILLSIFLIIFITFYLFKESHNTVRNVTEFLPFSTNFREQLVQQTRDTLYATIYGTVVVSIIQGIIGIIAFIALDSVSSPFFWGMMMAFAALLPFVGTALVWLPIGVFQVFNGYMQNSSAVVVKGIILLLVGAAIIGTVDNILKPKIIGKRSNLHPVLVLLGVFGGLNLMGFIGIIFGPLIIAIFVSFARVYKGEKRQLICE